jgi:hypothetical protein
MAKLTIRVDVEDGKTVSKFRTTRFNRIDFHNDGPGELKVVIQNATGVDSPICDSSGPVPSFAIPEKGDKLSFHFCGNKEKWTEFKYDATIGNYALEDPIVIIERSRLFQIFEQPAAAAFAGLAIGAVLAVVIMRMRASRTQPASR